MQPFVVITDTGADVPLSAAITSKVEFAHITYTIGDKTFSSSSCKDTDIPAFYNTLKENSPVSTSPVLPDAFYALWEPHLIGGRDILMLCISRFISKTFYNAQEARDMLLQKYTKRKIVIIDTLCAGAPQGMLAYEAAHRMEEGEDIFAVAQWVVKNRDFVNGIILPDSTKWLREKGLLSGGALGELLGKKLLLAIDNQGLPYHITSVKEEDTAIERMIDYIHQESGTTIKNQIVAITHGDNPALASKARSMILSELLAKDATIFPMGPITGCHIGPFSLGIAFFGRSRNSQ